MKGSEQAESEHHTTCPNCGAEHSDLMRQMVGRHLRMISSIAGIETTRSCRGSRRARRVRGMARAENPGPGVMSSLRRTGLSCQRLAAEVRT